MCPLTSTPAPGLALDRSLQAGPLHVPVQVRLGQDPTAELALVVRRTGADRIVVLTERSLPAAHLDRVLRPLETAAPTDVRRLPAVPPDPARSASETMPPPPKSRQ
ncbi:hypothetical protein ABZ318_39225 [Streptomyces sp. NPDC006197]|uniref:hypothetical protein n=1 Tax=Streptomyces sp. NPDC006197 TaxID=3156685 RepID=UPI00339EFAFA